MLPSSSCRPDTSMIHLNGSPCGCASPGAFGVRGSRARLSVVARLPPSSSTAAMSIRGRTSCTSLSRTRLRRRASGLMRKQIRSAASAGFPSGSRRSTCSAQIVNKPRSSMPRTVKFPRCASVSSSSIEKPCRRKARLPRGRRCRCAARRASQGPPARPGRAPFPLRCPRPGAPAPTGAAVRAAARRGAEDRQASARADGVRSRACNSRRTCTSRQHAGGLASRCGSAVSSRTPRPRRCDRPSGAGRCTGRWTRRSPGRSACPWSPSQATLPPRPFADSVSTRRQSGSGRTE